MATTASLVLAAAAFADEAVADGDGITPVTNQNMAFGSVDCGVSATKTALVALQRTTSGAPQIFQSGSTATVTILSVTGSGLSAVMGSPNTITLPSGWAGLSQGTMSAAVSSQVTVTSSTPGAGSGTVTYKATGVRQSDGAVITRQDPMTVTWTTGSCAPANTAPSVSVSGVSDGATYKFGAVPAATCNVTDTEDGNSSFAATLGAISGPLASYGLGSQTASCSYTDGGGLSASASATYSIVDTGAPTITDLGPTAGPNGSNSWYTTAVTNTFQAADSGAGFASPLTNPHEFTKDSGSAEGLAVSIASGAVSDAAGNSAASIDSAAFKIDLSDPYNVAFVGGPAAGSSHYFGSVPGAPTCTADDDVSGLASCTISGYSSAVGNHTLTATATDTAGRTAQATRSYSVLAWTLSGFYRPVDMAGVVNMVKGGSTVPLKFEIFVGATELTSTASIASFKVATIGCTALDDLSTDEIENYSTGGTSLRYDSVDGQFIQNWQTPKGAGKCYRVTMTAQDGSAITALFKTK
ncbi:MAG: PxKF domain-containing protein [Candidatus Limnocylindria bacterium]